MLTYLHFCHKNIRIAIKICLQVFEIFWMQTGTNKFVLGQDIQSCFKPKFPPVLTYCEFVVQHDVQQTVRQLNPQQTKQVELELYTASRTKTDQNSGLRAYAVQITYK